MRILILCLAFIFVPQIYAYSNVSFDAPTPVEKKAKIKKKIAKKLDKEKGMSVSTLLSVIGLIFVVPGAIMAIYGTVASLSALAIAGWIFIIIGLLFCLIGLIMAISKPKSGSMDGEKEEPKNGMQ